MRKNTIRLIVEVSILAALGLVFDLLCGAFLSFAWLNGGSISIACLPILIAAYKYDFKGGLLCGLLVGSIQLIWAKSSYLIHPVQVMLDYVIPYLLVGAVGAITDLANKTTESKTLKIIYLVTGIIIGFALKTLSQTLSGVWYWATPFAESLVYNGSYNAVSCLCCIVLAIPLSFNEAIMRRPDEEKAK